MTAAFADSSAIVKLYADEAGAAAVRRLHLVTVSQIARVEVPAALWRKHRLGELSPADVALLVAAFEADWFGTDQDDPRFVVVAPTPPVLEEAARLVGAHGLRAYDGVQLASAGAAREAAAGDLAFVAFDTRLREAATREGLEVL